MDNQEFQLIVRPTLNYSVSDLLDDILDKIPNKSSRSVQIQEAYDLLNDSQNCQDNDSNSILISKIFQFIRHYSNISSSIPEMIENTEKQPSFSINGLYSKLLAMKDYPEEESDDMEYDYLNSGEYFDNQEYHQFNEVNRYNEHSNYIQTIPNISSEFGKRIYGQIDCINETQTSNIRENEQLDANRNNKRKKFKPRKHKKSKFCESQTKISTISTRSSLIKFLESLDRLDLEMYNRVYNLNYLSKARLSNVRTRNIIRPCISLVNHYNLISLDRWRELDLFSRFYLRRVGETQYLFDCELDSNVIPDYSKDDFVIYRILANTVNSYDEMDYLIVQYLIDYPLITQNDRFIHRDYGEISIQPIENIEGNEHLDEYRQYGAGYFDAFIKSKSFDSREIVESVELLDSLPDLDNHFSNDYGKSFKYLNIILSKIPYPNGSFDVQFAIFNELIVLLNRLNKSSNYYIFPHIVGRISNQIRHNDQFNDRISKTTYNSLLIESTAASRIERGFSSDKQLIFALLISHNTLNNSTKCKHTSVGIFHKLGSELQVLHFEPSKSSNCYYPICSSLKAIKEGFGSKKRKSIDVLRSYGKQEKSKQCFLICLKYLCFLNENFDFWTKQNWILDSEEKKNKTRLTSH